MATKTVATSRPNILVIWGDDIGWFNPSCYHGIDGALERARAKRDALAACSGHSPEEAAAHYHGGAQPPAS
jgi:arylsulfatase A-like enzyme